MLTPHAGEAASLLGESRDDVEADPAAAALRAARQTGSVVLLKGERTHVVTPDGTVALVASSATPWLATAGPGTHSAGCSARARRGRQALAEASGRTLTPSDLAHLAATAAVVHGLAARRASRGGPFPITGLVERVGGVVRDLAVDGDAG